MEFFVGQYIFTVKISCYFSCDDIVNKILQLIISLSRYFGIIINIILNLNFFYIKRKKDEQVQVTLSSVAVLQKWARAGSCRNINRKGSGE